jgi:NitT/TauT family transport system ATP-binding protein
VVLSTRPGTVIDDVPVALPRPRGVETMADETFTRVCTRLRQLFGDGTVLD